MPVVVHKKEAKWPGIILIVLVQKNTGVDFAVMLLLLIKVFLGTKTIQCIYARTVRGQLILRRITKSLVLHRVMKSPISQKT